MSTFEKNREQRLRRALYKAGYALHKSRSRNYHLDDLCGYMIVLMSVNGVVAGSRYELDLDDVQHFLDSVTE